MICVPMTDWTTIRMSNTLSPQVATSNETTWLDLTAFQDIVAFLEVKNFTLGGATNITVTYQTAPLKDDALFVNVTSAVNLATGLTVTKMLKDTTTNPLSRWLRWQLGVSGTAATSTWDATLRIWIAANLSSNRARVPIQPDTRMRMLPGTPSVPLGANGGRVPASTGSPTIAGMPSSAIQRQPSGPRPESLIVR